MKTLAIVLMLAAAVSLTGCVMAEAPAYGAFFTQQKGPVSGVDNAVKPTKKGVAEATGIILVGTGDASIEAAMKNGDITKIHHIDREILNVLNVYCQYKTIVWGE